MIISFVCPSAPTPIGGVTALYEFANGLSRRGHEVHIAHGAFWGRPGVRSLAELPWFQFEPGVEHHFGEGSIPLPDGDVIFGTGAPPQLGLPVVVIQGYEMFPEEMEREAFRSASLKVCVASWLLGVGAECGVPLEQLVYVPYGIDQARFRVTNSLDARRRQVGMLYNSHIAKGWPDGRAVLELVHTRLPETSVLVFGTEVPDEPLPPWITFVKNPNPKRLVESIYNECSVFVQASLYEGFGFTAVEAMACGCALVTTENGGSDDYAIAGETALVAPPGDVEQLAANVETLLRDDGRRLQLARAGRDHVQRFRWDIAAELLDGYLRRYVADPASFGVPPLPV